MQRIARKDFAIYVLQKQVETAGTLFTVYIRQSRNAT